LISMKEKKGVRGGFRIGCNVCCRMLGRNQTLFSALKWPHSLAPAYRKDALKKHKGSQHNKSALEELGVQVVPNGNPLVGALPFRGIQ
jgi:hypothetical protein